MARPRQNERRVAINGLVLHLNLENVCLFAHARTGAVMGLTSAGDKVGYGPRRFQEDTRWSSDGWYELRGLPWELQQKNRVHAGFCPVVRFNLADDGAPVLAPPHRQFFQGQSVRNSCS